MFLKIMNNIDIIYTTATTTDQLGAVSVTQTSQFVPFFDFLAVFLVLFLSIASILVTDYFCYPRPRVIKLKNYLRVSKKVNF